MSTTKRLLTTAEAAVILKVGVRRVQAMIAAGRLRATKWGRDYFLELKDVLEVSYSNREPGRPRKSG